MVSPRHNRSILDNSPLKDEVLKPMDIRTYSQENLNTSLNDQLDGIKLNISPANFYNDIGTQPVSLKKTLYKERDLPKMKRPVEHVEPVSLPYNLRKAYNEKKVMPILSATFPITSGRVPTSIGAPIVSKSQLPRRIELVNLSQKSASVVDKPSFSFIGPQVLPLPNSACRLYSTVCKQGEIDSSQKKMKDIWDPSNSSNIGIPADSQPLDYWSPYKLNKDSNLRRQSVTLSKSEESAKVQTSRRLSIDFYSHEKTENSMDISTGVDIIKAEDWNSSESSEDSPVKEKLMSDEDLTLYDTEYSIGFIDTHCHLDFLFERLGFYEKTFDNFMTESIVPFPKSFEGCIAVFCKPSSFKRITWWENHLSSSWVWSAFGCHPHFSYQFEDSEEVFLRHAINHRKCVAVGEMGLDYSQKNDVSQEIQKNVFIKQLAIATESMKPIVIHCRDAFGDCLEIMRKHVPSDYFFHKHCFTGNWYEANIWLSTFSNCYLGFTCLILREYMRNLRYVVKKMPLNRLLIETDAPYFKPFGHGWQFM